MDMPKPTDAHRKLERIVGHWIGEERMNPSPWDPAGGTAVGHVVNQVALDGFVVVQDYEQERNGSITFRGHGVFSWDATEQGYVLHWFDSMGMPPNVFRGSFEENVLTLSGKDQQGLSRVTFDFSRDGQYTFRMEVSPDGSEWFTFMEAEMTRQG
jgi:hypothetical protein